MREWAMADNQSKNLPKADRQALNEVRHPPAGLSHACPLPRTHLVSAWFYLPSLIWFHPFLVIVVSPGPAPHLVPPLSAYDSLFRLAMFGFVLT